MSSAHLRLTGAMLLLSAVLAGCGAARSTAPPERLTFAVAASTRPVMADLVEEFTKETGVQVQLMSGSSAALAKQIAEGAPVDVFLAADPELASYLQQRRLVAQNRELLRNRLVVVIPADSRLQIDKLADLEQPGIKRLALAVESAPAGKYARQALAKAGVWDQVKDRVVGGDDVRATLAHVEQGADAGIVYATDAKDNPNVRVCSTIDEKLHDPIIYPLIMTTRAGKNASAQKLFIYLQSAAAAERFRRAGFTVLE